MRSTSDIDEIQKIFDFKLPDGDVQTGTAEFCDVEGCNDNDAGELGCDVESYHNVGELLLDVESVMIIMQVSYGEMLSHK